MIDQDFQLLLQKELAELRQENIRLHNLLKQQETRIKQLENVLVNPTPKQPGLTKSSQNQLTGTNRILTRHQLLKKLAFTGLVTGFSLTLSSPPTAQARVVTKSSGNPGAVIVCANATISGTVPNSGKYGLIATSEAGLNLSTLPVSAFPDTNTTIGVFGYASGGTKIEAYGVYGKSESGTGVYAQSNSNSGLYAQSNSGNAVYAVTNSGNGVLGQSKSGIGLAGYTDTNSGVYGQSSSGAGINGTSNTGNGVYGQSSTNNGVYGSSDSGNGVSGQSNSNYGLSGVSKTGCGVFAQSESNSALKAESNTGIGLSASSTSNYGLSAFSLTNSQLRLVPKENNLSGPPTSGMHYKGEIWLDDTGSLYICSAQGSPGNWQKITTVPA
jgi:hypothetical protein